jgi:integrase
LRNGDRPTGKQIARHLESVFAALPACVSKVSGIQEDSHAGPVFRTVFTWLASLPTDQPPIEATKKYYRVGWRLLAKTKLAGMRIDQITEDDIRETRIGSSPANTNNALRTLRRMLKRAQKQKNSLIAEVPVIEMVEDKSREMDLQPWMEERLLAITEIPRTLDSKYAPQSANYGWQPLRNVLVIILDTGMRPCEVFRMKREHIDRDRNRIFVPRSKSSKSRRFVGMTSRVRQALDERLAQHDSPLVFPSKRSRSGHIVSVQKQFDRAKKLAGIPDSIVLYCARHRFGTDAMDGTGNVYAVADAMGHSRINDVARRYQHPVLQKVTDAIEKRNKQREQWTQSRTQRPF